MPLGPMSDLSREPAVSGVSTVDFDALYRSEGVRLLGFATVLLRNHHRAEEVVHEAFIRVMNSWKTVEDPMPYLRTIVVNLCRDEWRSTKRRSAIIERNNLAAGPEPAAEDRAVENDSREQIWAAMEQLAPRQREVVTCRYLLEMSTEETAAATGISTGAVKSTLSAALLRLRELAGGAQ